MLKPSEAAALARRAVARDLKLWCAHSGVPWSDQVDIEISRAIGEVLARAKRREIIAAAYAKADTIRSQ